MRGIKAWTKCFFLCSFLDLSNISSVSERRQRKRCRAGSGQGESYFIRGKVSMHGRDVTPESFYFSDYPSEDEDLESVESPPKLAPSICIDALWFASEVRNQVCTCSGDLRSI